MEATYDRLTQYCPVRRSLEQRGFDLVGRLAVLTERLLRLTGHDHGAFVAAKAECASVRLVINDAHRELTEHRLNHGC